MYKGGGYKERISVQTAMAEIDSDELYSDVEMNKLEKVRDKSSIKSSRIRQYFDGHKGPYKVYIRKISQDIKYFELNKDIRKQYSTILDVFLASKNKISVTFSSIKEANEFPYNKKWNSVYKVYIPEASVEVMACVTLSIDEDEEELLEHGEGKFLNPHLKNITILEVLRFHKENVGSKVKSPTSVVRVTFPGQIIPERIEIEGLLIRTREFRRKAMFCINCLKYNHTSKLCNNRQVCKKCVKPECNCSEEENNVISCIHCKQEHETGSANCPKRILIQKKGAKREKLSQNRTYAEMLREAGDEMPGEDPSRYLNKPFNTSIRKRKLVITTPVSTKPPFTKKTKTTNESEDSGPPPGFHKAASHPDDEIHKFLMSLVKDLNLQPFVTQLIVKFVIPIVHQFIQNITNTVMDKIVNKSQ